MSQKEYSIQLPVINYFQSFFKDMFLSVSFFITLATAISKSSWVTCTRRSRKANMPASVHTAYTSPTHITPQNSQASCNPSIGLQQGNERFEDPILSFPCCWRSKYIIFILNNLIQCNFCPSQHWWS